MEKIEIGGYTLTMNENFSALHNQIKKALTESNLPPRAQEIFLLTFHSLLIQAMTYAYFQDSFSTTVITPENYKNFADRNVDRKNGGGGINTKLIFETTAELMNIHAIAVTEKEKTVLH